MLLFFPYARISEVPVKEVLECVLYVMYRWGHIKCFRFDNGRPFGDPKRQTLSPLALHLVARGCQVMFNPPRTPTKNAKVERCQGTTGKWADAKNCTNIEELRNNLDYAVLAQRQRLKTRTCEGQTRIDYYPSLRQNPRRFNSLDFDAKRVYDLLKKGQWYRKVSSVGQINMFAQNYQLGFPYRNQTIIVKLELIDQKPTWVCFDQKQQLINRLYAKNLHDESYFKF